MCRVVGTCSLKRRNLGPHSNTYDRNRRMDSYRMDYPEPARRRSWPVVVPALILIILAGGWSAFWFYAADKAQDVIINWRQREAKSGRVYGCMQENIGGFPFRIEVRCSDPQAEFRSTQPPLALRAADLLVALQIYQPKLLIAEFSGPLSVAAPGQPAKFTANWSLGRASVRGTPNNPERVSIVFDDPVLDRQDGAAPERTFTAKHAELHGRLAGGTVRDKPVIDLALSLTAAVAPALHPLAAQAFDADVDTQLIGLQNFDPKPWQQRFREIQQANGRIAVRAARIRQGDALAVAAGTLSLNASGQLNGELQVTVAGLDKLLPALNADHLVRPDSAAAQKLDSAFNSLDRVIPGLGGLARQRAGLGIAAGAALLGQPAELDGRKAVRLPLRFVDGEIQLGPIRIGKVGPLF
jgi:hypothetical protein